MQETKKKKQQRQRERTRQPKNYTYMSNIFILRNGSNTTLQYR